MLSDDVRDLENRFNLLHSGVSSVLSVMRAASDTPEAALQAALVQLDAVLKQTES